MADLTFLSERFDTFIKRGMLDYEPITLNFLLGALAALPEEDQTYIVDSARSTKGSFGGHDLSPDVMIARMLYHGSPLRCIEDVSFLRAKTEVTWDVLDDWHVDPNEDDWSTGPAALSMTLSGLNLHKLDRFNYDPAVSLRCHQPRTAAQCAALINIAWEIRCAADGQDFKNGTWWNQDNHLEASKPLFIEDASVAQLVADHPEYENSIIEFINTRGFDPELLTTTFENGVALPLTDGSL